MRPGEAELLIGGPPCTPFSKSGYWLEYKRQGLDPNASLLEHYLRVLDEAGPRAFILENVFALAYRNHNRAWLDLLLEQFERFGYRVRYEALLAADYAVRPGSHDWPYLSRMFAEALKWGFFGDVRSDPREWSYSTIRRKGQAWELAYEFSEPPATIARFTRSGSKISATGSGTVTIYGPRCTFTSELPFERTC